MSKIITVTLNPSLDRTLFTNYMAVGYHNTVTDTTRLDPAGRGVNLSRALHRLECETHALVMLGADAIGKAYQALLSEEAFPVTLIDRPGRTRSNTIILDKGQKAETQLIEESDGGSEEDIELIREHLEAVLVPDDIIVFSGVLPHGVPVNAYSQLIDRTRERGLRSVLSASGVAMEIGIKAQPEIVALRQNEVESLFNYPVRTPDDLIHSAQRINQRAGGGLVLASQQDADYAIAVDNGSGWIARGPEAQAGQGTMSGVHDALLAGFMTGYINGYPAQESLRLAMAAAAYTHDQAGNRFGTRGEVEHYLDQITLEQLQVRSMD